MSSCRLGGGTLSHTQWGQQVWRFPLTARSAVAEALEAAVGVRCTVEDVHAVPKAYLEVGHPHTLRLHVIESLPLQECTRV